jgi:hypothetical protein
MNLDFSKTAEVKQQNSNTVVKLKPGVHDNVFVTGVVYFTPEGKSPYMEVTFVKEDGSGQHKEKLYMSEGAMPYSLSKIKDLLIATKQEVPTAPTVEMINTILTGKKVALRLYGEEVMIVNDGAPKAVIVSKLAPTPFCAPCGETSSLSYDESRAIKKLAPTVTKTDSASDDLPF